MSEPPKLLPEGAVLAGIYEVRQHLGTVGDARIYLALDGSVERPRPQVLLARPAAAPPDLRPVSPAAGESVDVVPAVTNSFRTRDQAVLALACGAALPLNGYLPLDDDENAWALLLGLARGLRQLAGEHADCRPFTFDHLLLRGSGQLCYAGPVLPATDDTDPARLLAELAAQLLTPGVPWSCELAELVRGLGDGGLDAAVARLELGADAIELATTAGAATDCGPVRGENQDAAAAVQQRLLARDGETLLDILLVADGLGGHRDGQRASALALSAFLSSFQMAEAVALLAGDGGAPPSSNVELQKRLAGAFQAADETVAALSEAGETQRPGTTLVAAVRLGRRLFVGHVGDSRAGLCREGRLSWLTRDDSLAQVMIDRGELSPAQVWPTRTWPSCSPRHPTPPAPRTWPCSPPAPTAAPTT
ncbi:MAG: serine/threonine-protein phosphatase [Armatimonadetes bacterium]|nr:serine/threonine-protein phosphatase [Armatimonadota bacterium]